MKLIARRAALAIAAIAAVSAVVQLPVAAPTPPSLALTGAGSVTELQVTGRAGVPSNASAVVLNLTALDSNTPGFVTAYPCGSALPDVSNLNYRPGIAIANSATVPIGAGGKVCLYTSSATNLIADINGWYPTGSSFTTTTPTRLLDTRPNRAGQGAVTELQVTGRAGVPSNASAVVLNLTALDSNTPGFVTAYPCGSALPDVSNLNYTPGSGVAIANSATVPIGAGGKVCLYTSSATNLIADINGWYPTGSSFTTTTPTRLLDTRPNRAGQGAVTELQVTGRAGVPSNASAVVLNLTALDSNTPGFVTAYPCGSALPDVSNLNYTPGSGVAIANSATVPIGAGGKVCLYTSSATNLIADINGWYPTGSSFTTTTPTRLLDTRTPVKPTGQFVETFDGNAGLDRFNVGVYHREVAGGESTWVNGSWQGDHPIGCGPPEQTRPLSVVNGVTGEVVYTCNDHVMSSMGDVSGYSIVWFSPKQSFTKAKTVSWDVNVTDLGGRKWWEVVLVPTSFNSGTPSCPQCSQTGWLPADGIPQYPAGAVGVGNGPGGGEFRVISDRTNFVPPGVGQDRICGSGTGAVIDPEGCASKKIRRTWVLTDNGNGTLTVTALGRSYTFAGSFPAGGFNVVFKDHNYTPDKDGVPIGHTWHWDNIIVQ